MIESVAACVRVCFLSIALLVSAGVARAQTAVAPAAGDGNTTATAYQIATLGNLVWMHDQAAADATDGKYYKLANDIDASATAGWNNAAGFDPIGKSSFQPFRGIFLGQNHKITNLVINRPETTCIGLIGYTDSGVQVTNLKFVGGSVAGMEDVGSLIGHNVGGFVSGCASSATVSGGSAGGLVGNNIGGHIVNSSASGAVNGKLHLGGLVGTMSGSAEVSNCYATGAVIGTERIGGLIGYLAGGQVSNCYANGRVTGTLYVGGLIGYEHLDSVFSSKPWLMTRCHAGGAVSGTSEVGGLIGSLRGSGLTISDCYATGTVTGTGSEIGGLIGFSFITRLTLTQSYATGKVIGGDDVGGLIGDQNGLQNHIVKCWSSGAVTGSNFDIGGLVGFNRGATISQCYATGDVSGKFAGGLVGSNDSSTTVTDCFATGKITTPTTAGGLIGTNSGTVIHCYSVGVVTGTGTTFGGLIGKNSILEPIPIIESSYWDVQSSGRSTSAGGTGKTTAQMMLQSTFTGWDFASIWGLQHAYPHLRDLSKYTLTYSATPDGMIGDGTTTATTIAQIVNLSCKGQPMKAAPKPGYVFQFWDDGRKDNPRTDTNVKSNLSVKAYFKSTRNAAGRWLGYE